MKLQQLHWIGYFSTCQRYIYKYKQQGGQQTKKVWGDNQHFTLEGNKSGQVFGILIITQAK